MNRVLSSILLSCLIISQSAFTPATAQSQGMYDEAVQYVRNEGIAQGYLDGSFRPEQNINRAEFSKIIMLAASDDMNMGGSHCFKDVRNEWFAPYICTARTHGMVSGYPDGMFRPEQSISFAEASSLIAKAYHGTMTPGGEWYTPYIRQLDSWDAVPPTVRAVHDPLSRGEMAYIIMMADHAANGTSPSDEEEDEDEDEEDEDEEVEDEEVEDEEVDINVSIRTLQTEVAEGENVTFIISLENDGGEGKIDLDATLDSDLEFREAPGYDENNNNVISWENIILQENEDMNFVLMASVRKGAVAGKALALNVEAEDERQTATVTVKPGKPVQPYSPVGDPVLYWNYIALQAVANDHTGTFGEAEHGGPAHTARALAIVHAAIYDAVNSVNRTHQPYVAFAPVQQNEKVSLDTAVAAAAYKTLTTLYAKQKNVFEGSYQAHISKIADGAEKAAGIRVGETAAQQVLAVRQNDGSINDNAHTASNLPGRHRLDPLNPQQGYYGAKWGQVKPFAMVSGSQFRAPPPPSITSQEYATAYNEVKMLGSDGVNIPTSRNHEQTEIAIFWGYDGAAHLGTPPRLYNQIARVIALQKGNSITENARMFALMNIAIADAGIAAWESKYVYDYWRPVVGIREADQGTGPTGSGDDNPLTAGYIHWEPMGAPKSNVEGGTNFTPPFPAYPSGHATFGAAAFKAIENFYGTSNISFTFMSDELNGVTTDNNGVTRSIMQRNFRNLRDAALENALSRIYLGVHWKFDATSGMDMGTKIADYMHQSIMRPLP